MLLLSCAAGALSPSPKNFEQLLKEGFNLHQQARFAEAIPVLEQARRLQPDDYFVNLVLGIDLLRAGKAAEAVSRLETAARVNPKEEFPEEYLGEAQAALRQNASAASAYRQAMLRSGNSESSLEAWAGFTLERFRQIGESLRASREGLLVARRLQTAAKGAISTANCGPAIPVLERRLALHPERLDSEAAYRLSTCYAVEAGRAASALQSGSEDQAGLYRLRGDVLLRLKGDATAAATEYRLGLALHPHDPALLERIAEAEWSAGDADVATQSARAALAIDPHRSEALRTLASIAMSNREYEQALPLLRQLQSEAPGDRSVPVQLGRALAQTGQDAEALEMLSPALKAGYPDEKGALHALLARVFGRLGRPVDAAKAEAEARRLSDAFQDHEKTAATEGPNANE